MRKANGNFEENRGSIAIKIRKISPVDSEPTAIFFGICSSIRTDGNISSSAARQSEPISFRCSSAARQSESTAIFLRRQPVNPNRQRYFFVGNPSVRIYFP
jgi:hypothetical protein